MGRKLHSPLPKDFGRVNIAVRNQRSRLRPKPTSYFSPGVLCRNCVALRLVTAYNHRPLVEQTVPFASSHPLVVRAPKRFYDEEIVTAIFCQTVRDLVLEGKGDQSAVPSYRVTDKLPEAGTWNGSSKSRC